MTWDFFGAGWGLGSGLTGHETSFQVSGLLGDGPRKIPNDSPELRDEDDGSATAVAEGTSVQDAGRFLPLAGSEAMPIPMHYSLCQPEL